MSNVNRLSENAKFKKSCIAITCIAIKGMDDPINPKPVVSVMPFEYLESLAADFWAVRKHQRTKTTSIFFSLTINEIGTSEL